MADVCDRCYQPMDVGEHGRWRCPLEPRRETCYPNIIRDEIPGGMTVHNMTAQPETFFSKSEHRRRMKELGLENTVRHVGHNHTDKSPHTTRWT